MGRVLLSAGHGGFESGARDPGAVAGGTTEARETIELRDLIVFELRARNLEVLSVPDELSAVQTLEWINARALPGDVALELHANAFSNPAARGAAVYHIANNDRRKKDAELMLMALLRRVPQLPSRGARPDTSSGTGSLAFCRQLVVPSLLIEVGFLTNPSDRNLLQSRRRDFALGIAEGLSAWARGVAAPDVALAPEARHVAIRININGQDYGEQGIIVNDNSYIPADLVDTLGIDAAATPNLQRLGYNNVVYVRAVELRNFNISVGWDAATRTVLLRSILRLCPGQFDRIVGHGNTTEVQLTIFLRGENENAIDNFAELPKLYREEAATEGISHDIAFCQMCLETNFLRFDDGAPENSNNFAGLGAIGGGSQIANFPSARIGVRAHIQHLKAYASTEPVVREIVDPRFRFVTRGIAPLVGQLGGRWAADLQYGDRILALLRRLYESANIM